MVAYLLANDANEKRAKEAAIKQRKAVARLPEHFQKVGKIEAIWRKNRILPYHERITVDIYCYVSHVDIYHCRYQVWSLKVEGNLFSTKA